eukprot:g25689.t1
MAPWITFFLQTSGLVAALLEESIYVQHVRSGRWLRCETQHAGACHLADSSELASSFVLQTSGWGLEGSQARHGDVLSIVHKTGTASHHSLTCRLQKCILEPRCSGTRSFCWAQSFQVLQSGNHVGWPLMAQGEDGTARVTWIRRAVDGSWLSCAEEAGAQCDLTPCQHGQHLSPHSSSASSWHVPSGALLAHSQLTDACPEAQFVLYFSAIPPPAKFTPVVARLKGNKKKKPPPSQETRPAAEQVRQAGEWVADCLRLEEQERTARGLRALQPHETGFRLLQWRLSQRQSDWLSAISVDEVMHRLNSLVGIALGSNMTLAPDASEQASHNMSSWLFKDNAARSLVRDLVVSNYLNVVKLPQDTVNSATLHAHLQKHVVQADSWEQTERTVYRFPETKDPPDVLRDYRHTASWWRRQYWRAHLPTHPLSWTYSHNGQPEHNGSPRAPPLWRLVALLRNPGLPPAKRLYPDRAWLVAVVRYVVQAMLGRPGQRGSGSEPDKEEDDGSVVEVVVVIETGKARADQAEVGVPGLSGPDKLRCPPGRCSFTVQPVTQLDKSALALAADADVLVAVRESFALSAAVLTRGVTLLLPAPYDQPNSQNEAFGKLPASHITN